MILPGSFITSLLLLVLTLLCWGSWANTWKATGPKWRFELYYFDFAIGVMLAALICALSFGTFGWDGFSFLDDVRLAGKRQDLFAFGAGVVFNLGNMLLVAAISIAGISVAFPTGLGLALVVGALWSIFMGPSGNGLFRIGGALAIIVAIVVSTMAYRIYAKGAAIVRPSMTFLFVDEHPDSVNDAAIAVQCKGAMPGDPAGGETIIDFPASYHNGACGFSFADGHSEIHKWLGSVIKPPVTYTGALPLGVPAGNSSGDIRWMAERTTVRK